MEICSGDLITLTLINDCYWYMASKVVQVYIHMIFDTTQIGWVQNHVKITFVVNRVAMAYTYIHTVKLTHYSGLASQCV